MQDIFKVHSRSARRRIPDFWNPNLIIIFVIPVVLQNKLEWRVCTV